MTDKTVSKKKYASERQRKYYTEVMPKLSEDIKRINLGMRANTCLVSANILTLEQLKTAMENDEHIPMLDKEAKKEIINYLKKRY